MNVQQLIYSEFFNYSRARKIKDDGMKLNPPVSQAYSEMEVSNLIDSIVKSVNAELAALYFNEKERD